MHVGIAIYGTENITPQEACKLGELLFTHVGINVTGAGYYKFLEKGEHAGDHDIVEISLIELKGKIGKNAIETFRIYCEAKDAQPWVASFGYTTNAIGGFCYIDAQFPYVDDALTTIVNFFKALGQFSFSYGIGYFADKATKSFYYATGDNMVNLYPYENTSLFKRECPGRFEGQARYKSNMLRMVYLVNVINQNHLNVMVDGVSLKEWILSDEKHGFLEKLNNDMWLWEVQENNLNEVNTLLGQAGILLSWNPMPLKKTAKKLP